MDETLETMLRALESLDAPSVADRVSALDALASELPQLSALSSEDWDVKLASVEDDLDELGDAAERATARYEQARRAVETLRRFAQQRGAHMADRPSLFDELPASETGGRHDNPVAQAATTREAILQAMARRPHREWTPTAVTDDLMRYGRPVARSNVQVTLRRLADDGQVTRVGRGSYQIVGSPLDHPGDAANTERKGKKTQPKKGSGRWSPEVLSARAVKAAETRRRNREAAQASGS